MRRIVNVRLLPKEYVVIIAARSNNNLILSESYWKVRGKNIDVVDVHYDIRLISFITTFKIISNVCTLGWFSQKWIPHIRGKFKISVQLTIIKHTHFLLTFPKSIHYKFKAYSKSCSAHNYKTYTLSVDFSQVNPLQIQGIFEIKFRSFTIFTNEGNCTSRQR